MGRPCCNWHFPCRGQACSLALEGYEMDMSPFLSHIQSVLFKSWRGEGYDQFRRLDLQLRRADPHLRVQCCTTKASRAVVITCKMCGHRARAAYGTYTCAQDKKAAMEVLTEMFLGEALSQEQDGYL